MCKIIKAKQKSFAPFALEPGLQRKNVKSRQDESLDQQWDYRNVSRSIKSPEAHHVFPNIYYFISFYKKFSGVHIVSSKPSRNKASPTIYLGQ